MSRDSRRAPASRCLLVWSAVTAATALLLLVVRTELAGASDVVLAPAREPEFASVLTSVATLLLGASAAWLWCISTAATWEALRGVRPDERPGLRGVVRRVVLAGCGVAVVASVVPAHAEEARGVAGQPPEPLTASVIIPESRPAHTVTAGESLWAISESQLQRTGADSSDAAVDRAWRELWRANESVVGADPDRIEPGQHLEIPEALR